MKRRQSDPNIRYQRGSNTPSQSCANCKMFVRPGSCTLVEDPIVPYGWCQAYEASGVDIPRAPNR